MGGINDRFHCQNKCFKWAAEREANYSHEVLRFGGDARELPVAGGLSSPGSTGVRSSTSKQICVLWRKRSRSVARGEGGRPRTSSGTRLHRSEMPSCNLPGTKTGMKESCPHLPAASPAPCLQTFRHKTAAVNCQPIVCQWQFSLKVTYQGVNVDWANEHKVAEAAGCELCCC